MEIITLKIKIAPEIYTTVLKNINAIIAPTVVQPGCLDCYVYRGVEDKTTLLFIERWMSIISIYNGLRVNLYDG